MSVVSVAPWRIHGLSGSRERGDQSGRPDVGCNSGCDNESSWIDSLPSLVGPCVPPPSPRLLTGKLGLSAGRTRYAVLMACGGLIVLPVMPPGQKSREESVEEGKRLVTCVKPQPKGEKGFEPDGRAPAGCFQLITIWAGLAGTVEEPLKTILKGGRSLL